MPLLRVPASGRRRRDAGPASDDAGPAARRRLLSPARLQTAGHAASGLRMIQSKSWAVYNSPKVSTRAAVIVSLFSYIPVFSNN